MKFFLFCLLILNRLFLNNVTDESTCKMQKKYSILSNTSEMGGIMYWKPVRVTSGLWWLCCSCACRGVISKSRFELKMKNVFCFLQRMLKSFFIEKFADDQSRFSFILWNNSREKNGPWSAEVGIFGHSWRTLVPGDEQPYRPHQ